MRNQMIQLDFCLDLLKEQILNLGEDIRTIGAFLEHSEKRPDPAAALKSAQIYVERAKETATLIWKTRGSARALPLSLQAR